MLSGKWVALFIFIFIFSRRDGLEVKELKADL